MTGRTTWDEDTYIQGKVVIIFQIPSKTHELHDKLLKDPFQYW